MAGNSGAIWALLGLIVFGILLLAIFGSKKDPDKPPGQSKIDPNSFFGADQGLDPADGPKDPKPKATLPVDRSSAADNYPVSWSAVVVNTLRGSDGNAANPTVTEWYRQETGKKDEYTLVSMGDTDAFVDRTPGVDFKGVVSPMKHVFRSSGGHLMLDRVVSLVFNHSSGKFLFCAQNPSTGAVLQVDANAKVLTIGLGNPTSGKWDVVGSAEPTRGPGKRQVVTLLINDSPRALIYRCSGMTTNATLSFTKTDVPNEPMEYLYIGGKPGDEDASVLLYEMILTSAREVSPTTEGVKSEFLRLCKKWGVLPT